MTGRRAPRGRPRLPPEENATRERLLDTAQRLFAERGFSQVTLRELTAAAGTNLASVNYYFGSRDELLHALMRRAARAVHGKRTQLLEEAQRHHGTGKAQLRRILYALLEPAIVSEPGRRTDFLFGALLARAHADGRDELLDLLERQTTHLDPFAEALQRALPDLPREEIYWRLHFVLNLEHAVQTELKRLHYLSKGLCDIEDRRAIVDRIVEFALPGLLAPPAITDRPHRTAATRAS